MTVPLHDIEVRATAVLTKANALTAPVPVEQVAHSLGAQLHQEPLEDHLSGMLVCKGDSLHIVVNAGHHPNRKRFTVAHECGHLVLHHGSEDRLFVDTQYRVYHRTGSTQSPAYASAQSTTTPEEEREANLFASALLMPRSLIEQQVRSLNIDLTDEIGVSTLAITFV